MLSSVIKRLVVLCGIGLFAAALAAVPFRIDLIHGTLGQAVVQADDDQGVEDGDADVDTDNDADEDPGQDD